jgi:hypothetical protein
MDTRQPTLRSKTLIRTTRGDRYAKQLCSHATHMASRAQWTPPHGIIEFPGDMGTCQLRSEPDHLALTVEAADPASLARLQQIIGSDLQRLAGRDGLTIEWTQS